MTTQTNKSATPVPQKPERTKGRTEPAQPDPPSAAELVAKLGRRRRWPVLLLGLAVGAAGTYGVMHYTEGSGNTEASAADETVELATAPAERRDLLEEVEWAGTLQYGEPVAVASGAAAATGTVTGVTPLGTAIGRGTTVAVVDGEPVVAIYGDRPLWRELREGVEGADVLLLETNLVALGYDQDVTVSVDQEFTANTGLMVERWQEDLGMTVTGTVAPADVVVLPGPGVLTSEAEVGASAAAGLGTVSAERSVTDIVSRIDGLVGDQAPAGTEVEHGTLLFTIDSVPVVAVGQQQIAADPVLTELASSTFTDLELEAALAAEGHDPDLAMTVDGVITDASIAAINRWQDAAGLPVTGVAAPAYYQPVTGGQTVDAALPGAIPVESDISAQRPVLTTSTSELRVEVSVGVADADEFSEGQSVTITLADENQVPGNVVDVGPVTRANQQADPAVTVTIEVIADADTELVEGNVTVTTISEAIEGALTVPTRGLVSLAEGGFAVEVVNADGTTGLVAVEIGAFDDGYVEVTEGNISVGAEIVVPR